MVMKAVCSSKIGINHVELNEIERPIIKSDHILINVSACGINHGDLAWINGFIPRGAAPESLNDVAGVSGAGEVEEIGKNVPSDFRGRKVAFYRALNPSKSKVGAWSEYALMHYLDCVLLLDDAETLEYSGSLVNIVMPYAFIEHTQLNCKKAVIVTAGTSATGQALLDIAQEKNIHVISIVRNKSGKRKLEELNAEYIIVQSDSNFEGQLETLSQELNATTVFDGVGGALITKIAPLLPLSSTIYAYGFLAEYYTT
jgi:NADPH:quinone reductase